MGVRIINLTGKIWINRLIKAAPVILGPLALSACQMGTEIAVETVGASTIFTVTRSDKQPACVTNINVTHGDGTTGNASKWSLIQNYDDVKAGTNACRHIFIFGEPMPGYEQQYDGKPLEPGKSYYVSIGGGGLTGNRAFTVPK